jgi:hypothetical protein
METVEWVVLSETDLKEAHYAALKGPDLHGETFKIVSACCILRNRAAIQMDEL